MILVITIMIMIIITHHHHHHHHHHHGKEVQGHHLLLERLSPSAARSKCSESRSKGNGWLGVAR